MWEKQTTHFCTWETHTQIILSSARLLPYSIPGLETTATKLQFPTQNLHAQQTLAQPWKVAESLQSSCVAAPKITLLLFWFLEYSTCSGWEMIRRICLQKEIIYFLGGGRKKKKRRKIKKPLDWLQSSSKLDDTVCIKQWNSFHSNTLSLWLVISRASVTDSVP